MNTSTTNAMVSTKERRVAVLLSLAGIPIWLLYVLARGAGYDEISIDLVFITVSLLVVLMPGAAYAYAGAARKKVAARMAIGAAALTGAYLALTLAYWVYTGYPYLGGPEGFFFNGWPVASWPLLVIAASLFFGAPAIAARDAARLVERRHAGTAQVAPTGEGGASDEMSNPWLAALLSLAGMLAWLAVNFYFVISDNEISLGVGYLFLSCLAFLSTCLGYAYVGVPRETLLKILAVLGGVFAAAFAFAFGAALLIFPSLDPAPSAGAWVLVAAAAGLYFITPLIVAVKVWRRSRDRNREIMHEIARSPNLPSTSMGDD